MANISTSPTMKFNMPNDKVQLKSVWIDDKYEVIINESMGGTYTGTGEGSYSVGDMVTINATKGPEGMVFGWWESSDDINIENQTNPILTFTMPNHNVELAVTYQYG